MNKIIGMLKGGSGSGNFGHSGRPGERGGSDGSGGESGKGTVASSSYLVGKPGDSEKTSKIRNVLRNMSAAQNGLKRRIHSLRGDPKNERAVQRLERTYNSNKKIEIGRIKELLASEASDSK